MGYVYKITNTINGKAYIGISVHEPTQGRIKEHLAGRGNRIIARAVKKYGKDAFTYEILEANVFDELLPDLEVAYIANYNTISPNGYNLTSGGDKHKRLSAETRLKISEKQKGRPRTLSEAGRRKISELAKARTGDKNPCFGRKLSEGHRRKLQDSRKGKPLTESHRRKLSEAHKGKKHSDVTRKKLSELNSGKTLSVRTRQKISEKAKGKKMTKENKQKLLEANRHPDYEYVYSYFFSLSPEMSLTEKRRLMYNKFPHISGRAIRKWTTRWMPNAKSQKGKWLKYKEKAYELFMSLPPTLTEKEKRKILRDKMQHVPLRTIHRWVQEWVSTT